MDITFLIDMSTPYQRASIRIHTVGRLAIQIQGITDEWTLLQTAASLFNCNTDFPWSHVFSLVGTQLPVPHSTRKKHETSRSAFRSATQKKSRPWLVTWSKSWIDPSANSHERTFDLTVMPKSSKGEIVDVDPNVSSPVRLVPRVVFHLVEGI